MNLYDFKKSFYSGIVFFGTILILSATYAAFQTINSSEYAGWQSLSSSLFGKVVGNVDSINDRTAWITSSGGNIGIGTTNPTTTLDINGKIKATSFWFDIVRVTDSITKTGWKNISVSCPLNYTVISWGCNTISDGGYLIKNMPYNNGWNCYAYDTYAVAYSTSVYAICIRTE